MTDLHTENARLRAAIERIGELNMLPPDENGHRWWSSDLIGQEVVAALATPAPDAVQEAARVPEIAALIEAARNLVCHDGWGTVNYTDNGMWLDAETLRAVLRAIAGDRT